MIYLKNFENLGLQKQWGLILSDEDFKKYAEEFDSIIEAFLEYADDGYPISFSTAYGSAVRMTYDQYLEKGDKYKEFINGLPVRGLFFESSIRIPYDYQLLLNILEDVQSCVGRLSDKGWLLDSFSANASTLLSSGKKSIVISHSFEKNKK